VIVADDSKLVDRLGTHVKLPVALLPFARSLALRHLATLGVVGTIRQSSGRDFVTDDGLLIADCVCGTIDDPMGLVARLGTIPGIVDCGLFLRIASEAIIAGAEGVWAITAASP
jgi:ribose 5-phosphate isomerase A